MSIRIEWARAVDLPVLVDEVDARSIEDAYGNRVDRGNLALCVSNYIVVEGTREQLRAWANHVLSTLDHLSDPQ